MSFRFSSIIVHARLISGVLTNQVSGVVANQVSAGSSLCYTVQRRAFCSGCVRHRSSVLSRTVLNTTTNDHSSPSSSSVRQHGTVAMQNPGLFSTVKKMLGFYGNLRYSKGRLRHSGMCLYVCCTDLIDHATFFEELGLPDTYNSWFRITELHLWLVMCRLASEQEEGIFARNQMIKSFWKDGLRKVNKIGGTPAARAGYRTLTEQFKGQLIAYDEGAMSDDKGLAGAVWRAFYDQNCQDIEKIELMVQYVRKQLNHLDKLDTGEMLGLGLISFLPLHPGDDNTLHTKQIHEEIITRIG